MEARVAVRLPGGGDPRVGDYVVYEIYIVFQNDGTRPTSPVVAELTST